MNNVEIIKSLTKKCVPVDQYDVEDMYFEILYFNSGANLQTIDFDIKVSNSVYFIQNHVTDQVFERIKPSTYLNSIRFESCKLDDDLTHNVKSLFYGFFNMMVDDLSITADVKGGQHQKLYFNNCDIKSLKKLAFTSVRWIVELSNVHQFPFYEIEDQISELIIKADKETQVPENIFRLFVGDRATPIEFLFYFSEEISDLFDKLYTSDKTIYDIASELIENDLEKYVVL